MTLKHEQMPRQLEILVWTDEERLGENPFVISTVIVNSLTDKLTGIPRRRILEHQNRSETCLTNHQSNLIYCNILVFSQIITSTCGFLCSTNIMFYVCLMLYKVINHHPVYFVCIYPLTATPHCL